MSFYVSRNGRQVCTSLGDFRRRNDYAYGKWTCEDGREILFNRFYEPIWQRWNGSSPQPADPSERVSWKEQEWFYNDDHKDKEKVIRGAAALREWGIPDPYSEKGSAAEELIVIRELQALVEKYQTENGVIWLRFLWVLLGFMRAHKWTFHESGEIIKGELTKEEANRIMNFQTERIFRKAKEYGWKDPR